MKETSHKKSIVWFHLHVMSRRGNSNETERLVVVRKEVYEERLICMDFLLRMMKMFWTYILMVTQSYEYTKNWLVQFKRVNYGMWIIYQFFKKFPLLPTIYESSKLFHIFYLHLLLSVFSFKHSGKYTVGSHCFNCIFC